MHVRSRVDIRSRWEACLESTPSLTHPDFLPPRMREERTTHSRLQFAKWSVANDCTTGSSWWKFRDLGAHETCTDHYLSPSIYGLAYTDVHYYTLFQSKCPLGSRLTEGAHAEGTTAPHKPLHTEGAVQRQTPS